MPTGSAWEQLGHGVLSRTIRCPERRSAALSGVLQEQLIQNIRADQIVLTQLIHNIRADLIVLTSKHLSRNAALSGVLQEQLETDIKQGR